MILRYWMLFLLNLKLLTKDCSHQLLHFGVDPSNSVQSHCIYACMAMKMEIKELQQGTKIFCSVKTNDNAMCCHVH